MSSFGSAVARRFARRLVAIGYNGLLMNYVEGRNDRLVQTVFAGVVGLTALAWAAYNVFRIGKRAGERELAAKINERHLRR